MASRHSYGDDPSQYGVLYGEGPVAVVIHGGFWKAEYDLTLMDALCEDLAGRGFTAYNIEYRRLGNGGGVPATLDDVSAAIDHLATLDVDLSRVVTIGHSAGGHLAAWAATREDPKVAVTHVVSQAGVLDLQRARELRLSDGVVDRFLGEADTKRRLPDRAPAARRADAAHARRARRHVPLEISERFAEASGATLVVEPEEGHMGHIDPSNPLWKAVTAWL